MIIVNMQPIAGRNEGAAGYNQKRVNAIQALSKPHCQLLIANC